MQGPRRRPSFTRACAVGRSPSLAPVSPLLPQRRSHRRTCNSFPDKGDDRLIPPTPLDDPRPVAQRDLVLGPALHRRAVSRQRDQIVADGGNLHHQVLAGRVVSAAATPPAISATGPPTAARFGTFPASLLRHDTTWLRG